MHRGRVGQAGHIASILAHKGRVRTVPGVKGVGVDVRLCLMTYSEDTYQLTHSPPPLPSRPLPSPALPSPSSLSTCTRKARQMCQ